MSGRVASESERIKLVSVDLQIAYPGGTGAYKHGAEGATAESSGLKLSIGSNPASSSTELHVEGPANRTVGVRLINLLGQVVRAETLSLTGTGEAELPLDLTGLATGSYVISVTGSGMSATAMLSVRR